MFLRFVEPISSGEKNMLLQLLIVKSKLEKEERVSTYLYLFLHMKLKVRIAICPFVKIMQAGL